jgi:hypothetical protein
MRLKDPVMHRRTLDLDARSRILTIRDEIIAKGSHKIGIYFHLSEECIISNGQSNQYEIDVRGRKITFELDTKLSVETLKGNVDPIGGWIGRGYHQKFPSGTIIGRRICHGETSFACRVVMDSHA